MNLFIVNMLGNGLDCYNDNVYTIKLLLKKKNKGFNRYLG